MAATPAPAPAIPGVYVAGSVKQDPTTGAVAIRTRFPDVEPLTQHAWLAATKSDGAQNLSSLQVADWDDVALPYPPTGQAT